MKEKIPAASAPSKYKLGRLPARHTLDSLRRKMRLGVALESLGAPPSASDDFVSAVEKATGGDWGMMGNDEWGDCTCADTAHQVMLRTANASKIVIPTTEQCLAAYSDITGFKFTDATDNGADELSVIQYLANKGWLGFKDDSSGNVDPAQMDHVKWAIQLCGASRIGIRVTKGMEDQFAAGNEWDGSGDQTVTGLHDVPIVKYDKDGTLWVVTWAKLHPMTPGCFAKIADEAHMEYSDQWLQASGLAPNGMDRAALINAMQLDRSYADRLREGI